MSDDYVELCRVNRELHEESDRLRAENEELVARLQDEVASLSSLLLAARENEQALGRAVARREEEIGRLRAENAKTAGP